MIEITNKKIKVQKLTPQGLPSTFTEEFEKHLFIPTYALTNHKSQGSEQPLTFPVYGKPDDKDENLLTNVAVFLNRRAGYTAFTRHQTHCYLFATEYQLTSMLKDVDDRGYTHTYMTLTCSDTALI